MRVKTINEAQIIETWSETIKESLGENVSADKMKWLAKVVNNQALLDQKMNEDVAVRGQVPGMGDFKFPTAGQPSGGGASDTDGSGDQFKTLLPLTMEVAGATVGFDILSVFPIDGPGGVVPYVDYVLANNVPAENQDKKADLVELSIEWGSGETPVDFVEQQEYTFSSGGTDVKAFFVGAARLTNRPIFALSVDGAKFGDVVGSCTIDGTPAEIAADYPRALENVVVGYSKGNSVDPQDMFLGHRNDGKKLFNPLSRGTGEGTQSKSIGIKTYTKPVEVGTITVDAKVTKEQLKDLPSQWGIDIISLVKDVLVENLSQEINAHILSQAMAMGWQHHSAFYANGMSLNLNVKDANTSSIDFVDTTGALKTISIPEKADFGDFENQSTIHDRIYTRIMAISNLIHKRGRRGPGNFIVTNLQVATALQASSKFTFAPKSNTLTQNPSTLYLYGDIVGMPLYVDPSMDFGDTRVLIGRKGMDTDPGLKFVPYVLAESIEIIAESTMAPRIEMYSRYDLVSVGHHPETQYFTFWVEVPTQSII